MKFILSLALLFCLLPAVVSAPAPLEKKVTAKNFVGRWQLARTFYLETATPEDPNVFVHILHLMPKGKCQITLYGTHYDGEWELNSEGLCIYFPEGIWHGSGTIIFDAKHTFRGDNRQHKGIKGWKDSYFWLTEGLDAEKER